MAFLKIKKYFINRITLAKSFGAYPFGIKIGDYFKWSNNITVVYIALVFHLVALINILVFLDHRADKGKRAVTGGQIDFDDPERIAGTFFNSVDISFQCSQFNFSLIFVADSLDTDVLEETRRVKSLRHERDSGTLPPLLVDSVLKTFPLPTDNAKNVDKDANHRQALEGQHPRQGAR